MKQHQITGIKRDQGAQRLQADDLRIGEIEGLQRDEGLQRREIRDRGLRKIERTPETALRNGGVGLILQQQEFAFDP